MIFFRYILPIFTNIMLIIMVVALGYIGIKSNDFSIGLSMIVFALLFYNLSKSEFGIVNIIKQKIAQRKKRNEYKEWAKEKVNRRYSLHKHKEINLNKILKRYNQKGFYNLRRPGIYVREVDVTTLPRETGPQRVDIPAQRVVHFEFQDHYIL